MDLALENKAALVPGSSRGLGFATARLLAQESSLGRMGTPEEFANAAVFLVSPAASYLTCVMLAVNGDMVKGTL